MGSVLGVKTDLYQLREFLTMWDNAGFLKQWDNMSLRQHSTIARHRQVGGYPLAGAGKPVQVPCQCHTTISKSIRGVLRGDNMRGPPAIPNEIKGRRMAAKARRMRAA